MTFPGLGGQQPPPQNAAPAQQPVPGVTPGVSGQIVASRVIIIGSGGELLVYSPTAGAGNLIASIAGMPGTDSFGNAFVEGVAAYATISGVSYVMQLGTQTIAGTTYPALFFEDSSSPPVIPPAVVGSGGAGGAGLQVYSGQSTAGATVAAIVVEDSVLSGDPNGAIGLEADVTVTQSLTVGGTLTVGGSTSTGTAQPAGVPTGGPNGGVFAGHTHDFDGHTHPL